MEKCATLGELLQCDPGQWELWEDQSTQCGSDVCEYPFRHMFQTDDKNTYYELILVSQVFSKFLLS